ncbi:MAG: hypothetical protein AAGD25_06400 [Cyanobacteria bacterium P01_F01_bin.150]
MTPTTTKQETAPSQSNHELGAALSPVTETSHHSTPIPAWSPDDWETPDSLAAFMAALVQPNEMVLEPFAGTGQIAKFFRPGQLICGENNPARYAELIKNVSFPALYPPSCSDFFSGEFKYWSCLPIDVVCTNPPFSRAVDAIKKGLEVLDSSSPSQRLLYLLPHDWDQAQGRNAQFSQLDCHIHHIHKISGRVAYLKDGVPHSQRQIYDAVFDIRPGKVGGCVSYFHFKKNKK